MVLSWINQTVNSSLTKGRNGAKKEKPRIPGEKHVIHMCTQIRALMFPKVSLSSLQYFLKHEKYSRILKIIKNWPMLHNNLTWNHSENKKSCCISIYFASCCLYCFNFWGGWQWRYSGFRFARMHHNRQWEFDWSLCCHWSAMPRLEVQGVWKVLWLNLISSVLIIISVYFILFSFKSKFVCIVSK